MQQFYGTIKGRGHTLATRIGTKSSGLQVKAKTRNGEIQIELFYDKLEKCDKFEVYLKHYHKGPSNTKQLLAQGIIED